MSAIAPALASTKYSVVIVRLADVSLAMGSISGSFALLLLLFPVWFPQQVFLAWQRGYLATVIAVFTLLLDGTLYFRIAQMHSAKPGILHAVWLGSMPVLVSLASSLVLQSAISDTIQRDLPSLNQRVVEEVVAHTYLGIMSAVFVPFLIIRLTDQFRRTARVAG